MNNSIIQALYTQEQLDYLSSLHFINQIDVNLKAVSSANVLVDSEDGASRIRLMLELYFYDKKIDTLSFDLHNFEYDDVIHLMKNIKGNDFILHEIDNFLAGDIVE